MAVGVLVLQLAVLAACCWLAVRLATRPFKQLARAADTLGPDLKAERLSEDGPDEVARAARAFNAMQDRITMYMTERLQILAAISHDLQTPITRMRLRLDVMDETRRRKTAAGPAGNGNDGQGRRDLCAHDARRK